MLAIVVEALVKGGPARLELCSDWWIAVAAFAALFLFKLPFPVVIRAAALRRPARPTNQ